MKNTFLALLTFCSFAATAQKKIDGFYSGTLFNDTTKMVQKYELAIAEYRGKITGYSYVTFVAKDTFFWGIRKVKAEIVGDSLIVEDDKIVANNFPEPPSKKVGRIITIPLNGQDSLVTLNGRWKTNQTKTYYSVPGSIDLSRSTDSTNSPLIHHLLELGLIEQPRYAATTTAAPVAEKQKKVQVSKPSDPKTKNIVSITPAVPAPIPYDQRKVRLQQTIEVSSDSLVLAFYDNGMVDGDSVSVYVNGKAVITQAKLLAVATKKTISVAGLDEIDLMLVAENLGTIPPNTGLVTIKDGERSYQVNFSADLQTNARILIKRKK